MTIALPDLERSVIGAVLLRADNLALLPDLEPSHFAGPFARATWTAIRNLETKNLPIDLATIGDELGRMRAHQQDSRAPGDIDRDESTIWTFLGECADHVPTIDNACEYARRVKDHALKRRLIETLGEVLHDAKASDSTGAELLTSALAGLSVLDAEQPEQTASVGQIVKRRLAQLDQIMAERQAGQRALTGFYTGVAQLDDKLGGWQPGIVSIVAARPGMGKSSLGLATADACSAKGIGVHLFSLEDTESAYADRVLSRTSNVPAETLRNCALNQGQMQNVQRAATDVTKRVGWIVDGRSGITATEIVRSVRRQRRSNATRVAIVDYVQLVAKPPHGQRWSSHEHLTDAVTTLADAAKQDGLAYVVMSQLNREIEKREDRRPQLSDLRESGSLEERAKCVVGVYRGAAYGGKPKRGIDFPKDGAEPSESEFERMAQLLVLKNSNGRTGVVRATWNGPTTKME